LRYLKKKFLPWILAFVVLTLLQIYIPPGQGSYYTFNTTWIPNPEGLNTQIRLNRYFLFQNVTLDNETFYAYYENVEYWLNVTSGSNVILTLENWFDNYGTAFSVNKACSITLYLGNKGSPSKVNGASSVYNAGSKTLDLTVSEASYVGIHWSTGASVKVSNSEITGFFHSCDSPPGYKTIYGYGITRGGYWQYGFQTRTYCKNGKSDIETIKLSLGNGSVSFTFTEGKPGDPLSENDPNDLCQIAEEWYEQHRLSAWVNYDSETQYLDVGFNIRFLQISGNESVPEYWFMKYQPYLTNQNTTVTVTTKTDGTQVHEQPAIFFIGLTRLPNIQPIPIPWELSFFMIGLGGIFLLNFSLIYAVWKIKHHEIPEGIGYGVMLFFISIALIVIWLWK